MRNNKALIWNGFTHRWLEENHRMARIGNRVRELSSAEVTNLAQTRDFLMNNINPFTLQPFSLVNPFPGFDENADANYQILHTAASGSEPDTADYRKYFTSVQSPSEKISFIQGESTINIQGNEDVLNAGQVNISGSFLPFLPTDQVESRFLINGFDIVRTPNQEAKKFHRMDINFSNENVDPIAGTFSARINASLFSTCQSAECWDIFPFAVGGFSPLGEGNRMQYTVRVSWVLVVGEEDELLLEDRTYQETMNWGNKDFNPSGDTHFMSDFIRQDTVPVPSDKPFMCPAYRSISYDLTMNGGHIHQLTSERSFHMLELHSYLKPTLGTNSHTLEYLTFFKNWKEHMGHFTAYGVAGQADFNIGVCLMHFKNPSTVVVNHERTGNFRWETTNGSNADPNSNAATHSHYFNLSNLNNLITEEKTLSLIPNSNDSVSIEIDGLFIDTDLEVEVDFSNAPHGSAVQFSSKLLKPIRFLDTHNFYPINHYQKNEYLFAATKSRSSTGFIKQLRLPKNEQYQLNFQCAVDELPFLNSSNYFYSNHHSIKVTVKRQGVAIYELTIKLRFFIAPFVGNINATPCKELHMFGCESEMLMSTHNRRPYYSIQDAHNDNYDNGHNCLGGSTC